MDGLEIGLSDGFRLSVMAGYGRAIKRYGVWGRAAAAVVMIVAASLFASPAWRVVQFVPLVCGLALAGVDAYPASWERVAGDRRSLRWSAGRAGGKSTVAAVNLSGLLECAGVVTAGMVFTGPVPMAMPSDVRVVGLVAVTAFAWSALSQVTADPGFYNADLPPARLLVVARWMIPAAATVVAFVLFTGVGADGTTTASVPTWVATSLAGSFLLLWPYLGVLNLLLRCACSSANTEVVRNLEDQAHIHHEYIHRAKNELRPEFRDITSDAEYDAYSAAVVIVENARRDICVSASANLDDTHPVAELWNGYQGAIAGAAVRGRLRLVERTGGRRLSHMEGMILQSIFVGLVSNALRASQAGPVTVAVSDEIDEQHARLVRVVVEDDGIGGAPSVFEWGSSLASLDRLCSRFGGGVQVAERESGGTRAIATFTSPYRLVGNTGNTNETLGGEFAVGQLPDTVARRRPAFHLGRSRLALPRK